MRRPKSILLIFAATALLIMPHAASSQRSTASRSTASDGEKQTSRFWAKYVAACGNSHYIRKGPAVFVELKGFRIQTKYFPLTQADKLNGVEAKGITWITMAAHRFYSNESWREWADGEYPDFTLVNSVGFQNVRRSWTFDVRGYFNQVAKQVSCAEVPGLRSSSLNEVASNSVRINDNLEFPIKNFIFGDSHTNIVSNTFPQSTTTFVYWKITYPGTAFTYSLPPVESRWFKNGQQWAHHEAANFDNVSEGHLWASWGWKEPGRWEVGKYTVKVYLRKQLIAQKSFEIVPDESLPSELRYDGVYYREIPGQPRYWFVRFFPNGIVRDLAGPMSDSLQNSLRDARKCTDDFMLRGYNFETYCKNFSLGEGRFSLHGTQLQFTTTPKAKRLETVEFGGEVSNTTLKLTSKSTSFRISGSYIFVRQ